MEYIVIFSSGRSGGNLLDNIIKKYRNVKVLGEFHNRRLGSIFKDASYAFERCGRYAISNEKLYDILNNRYKDKYDIITTRFHNYHFKFSYNYDAYDLFDNFHKIILYRESVINKLVSMLIVLNHNNRWHYSKNDKLPQYDKYSIYVGRNYVEHQLNCLNGYYNGIIDRWGSENIEFVKYEDLIKNNDISHIANRFGFSGFNDNIQIPTVHINKNDDGYKRVINYDELKDLKLELKKTDSGWRFA